MRMRLLAENPGDIEFTLKVTMTADQWEELRDSLQKAADRGQSNYPASQLTHAITSILCDARKTFWSDSDDGKDALS